MDEVKNADEMDCVIRLCDDAFQKAADVPISKRSMYAGLLSKVYTKGHFFLAYRERSCWGIAPSTRMIWKNGQAISI